MDWMYKGLEGMVNEDSYLLGRSVDKTFDQIKSEKEKKSADSENGLAKRTLSEDPLLLIKKKEIETRQQLLKNPVKLKKMQEMLKRKQKMEMEKIEKKNRKEDLELNLDKIIIEMYQDLKQVYHVHSLEELINMKMEESDDNDEKEGRKMQKESHEEKLNRKIEKKLEKLKKRKKGPDSESESCSADDERAPDKRKKTKKDDSTKETSKQINKRKTRQSSESSGDDDNNSWSKKKERRKKPETEVDILEICIKYKEETIVTQKTKMIKSTKEEITKENKNMVKIQTQGEMIEDIMLIVVMKK
uniref:Pre-mRNA-splicing factor CWC25 homolog n=1 Tax=Cacopsylla melanoneura TaxID=428564 RepID=A0A8D8WHQ9_9HEMI